jgi:Xaa-Pro aminopeptidase
MGQECAINGVDRIPRPSVEGAFDETLDPGSTLCVDALVGEVGGDHMVKLEDQGVTTEDGFGMISTCPLNVCVSN